jgi:hypothetical protein
MFMILANVMNGTHARQTNDIFQLKINPITTPDSNPNIASKDAASPSALTPFNVCTSLAIVAERTPGEFSFSSNHPRCFYRIDP